MPVAATDTGIGARWFLQTPRRVLVGALALAVMGIVLARSPSASTRVLDALTAAARQHTGHVFTVGHAYKTLDEKFYAKVDTPSTSQLKLTPAEAARYVARSGLSFVTVPPDKIREGVKLLAEVIRAAG